MFGMFDVVAVEEVGFESNLPWLFLCIWMVDFVGHNLVNIIIVKFDVNI